MEDVNHRETRYTLHTYTYANGPAARFVVRGMDRTEDPWKSNKTHGIIALTRLARLLFRSGLTAVLTLSPRFNTLPFALVSFPSSARDDCLRFEYCGCGFLCLRLSIGEWLLFWSNRFTANKLFKTDCRYFVEILAKNNRYAYLITSNISIYL